jgi:hypothetical protein
MVETTPALQYIQSKGWKYKESGDKIELENCPFCKLNNTKYGHFYMVISHDNRDGLYTCHRCGKSGHLNSLKIEMGDKVAGISSFNESKFSKVDQMPDVQAAHEALLENENALDYLINVRGLSLDIIKRQKIGYFPKQYFRECGEVPAIGYPYLVGSNSTFYHFRTLPDAPKAFSSLKGWDAPLYNQEVIKEGLKELIMVEGEINTITALQHGIESIVGVPGANFKKAMWLEQLDALNLEKIYICYDTDKVGQKAAQTLASRIGIEKCYKLVLPSFTVPLPNGETKKGKDLNEWFMYGGGTEELFEQLKAEATLFDIQGVSNTLDALQEFEEKLNGKTTLVPTYLPPWKPLQKLVGFEDGDVIDILAPEKIGKTTIGMNMMEYMTDTYNEDGIIICGEMPNERMLRKWISHVTQTPDLITPDQEEGKIQLQLMKEAVVQARAKALNRTGVLYFCYPQIKEIDDVYKLMIDCIRRYGVKWIMLDNIQLFADRTLKNGNHRTIHLSQISKTTAGIAKDYGIKLIRILQPHRIKDGAMINTDNTDGASQIAKDCDCTFTAFRNRIGQVTKKEFEQMEFEVETTATFEPKMLFTVGLTRYSSGGQVLLELDGVTSTVREYDPSTKYQSEGAKPASGYTLPTEKLAAVVTI